MPRQGVAHTEAENPVLLPLPLPLPCSRNRNRNRSRNGQ